MNTLYFSVDNALVSMDGYLGSFEVPDADYSCLWDVYRVNRESIAMIDLTSFQRKVFIKPDPTKKDQPKFEWVKAQLDAPYVQMLEERLQAQVEREAYEDRRNVREVAEMRA